MQLFNVRRLAKRLSTGQVGPREQMHYLLVFTLINAFAGTSIFSHYLAPKAITPLTIALDVLTLFFEGLIVVVAYRINNRGDGRDFIMRFLCISVPLLIRTIFISFVCIFVASTFLPLPPEVVSPIVTVTVYLYILTVMIISMRVIAGRQEII
jgi:hypothetical protein